jgi:glycosyltransferase involved in cell wall biosynthesis
VYNSNGSLPELAERATIAMAGFSYEIVFIDDGSKDDSWQQIEQLKVRYPDKVKAIRFKKNYGQHAAMLCAFNYAKGQYIVTIDDDLQYAPEDILKLIARQQETGAEVVYAVLIDRQHSALRTTSTKLMQRGNKIMADSDIKGSSFRLICREVIDKIIGNHRNAFLFLDEVLLWYTTTFAYVDVKHYPRKHGKTGYNMAKLVKMYFSMVTNYSAAPLKAMVNAGFIFSLLFFLIGLRIIYIKVFRGVPIEGWTSIMVAIFFSTSVVMFCLGILGIYLFKMFLAQQNKPLYTIKQVL